MGVGPGHSSDSPTARVGLHLPNLVVRSSQWSPRRCLSCAPAPRSGGHRRFAPGIQSIDYRRHLARLDEDLEALEVAVVKLRRTAHGNEAAALLEHGLAACHCALSHSIEDHVEDPTAPDEIVLR